MKEKKKAKGMPVRLKYDLWLFMKRYLLEKDMSFNAFVNEHCESIRRAKNVDNK